MGILEGKVAVVTGATGALGMAVAEEMLRQGACVVGTYLNEDKLKNVMPLLKDNKDRFMVLQANVTKEKQAEKVVTKAIRSYGGLHVLANIVGGFTYAPVIDTDLKTLDRMMEINFKTAFVMSKAVLPHMMDNHYGRIINVSSRPALGGAPGVGAYAASKAALLNFTQTLAAETLEYNITVNAVLPSTLDTEANRVQMPDADYSKWVPPTEVARVIAFLASDESNPVSGAAVPVYGRA